MTGVPIFPVPPTRRQSFSRLPEGHVCRQDVGETDSHCARSSVSFRQACVNRIEAYGIVVPWVCPTRESKEARHGRVEQVETRRG